MYVFSISIQYFMVFILMVVWCHFRLNMAPRVEMYGGPRTYLNNMYCKTNSLVWWLSARPLLQVSTLGPVFETVNVQINIFLLKIIIIHIFNRAPAWWRRTILRCLKSSELISREGKQEVLCILKSSAPRAGRPVWMQRANPYGVPSFTSVGQNYGEWGLVFKQAYEIRASFGVSSLWSLSFDYSYWRPWT